MKKKIKNAGWAFIMSKKKSQAAEPLSARDMLKMEIAKEMGVWEQVEKEGWKSMTNATCGRVGGIMRKRLQEHKNGLS